MIKTIALLMTVLLLSGCATMLTGKTSTIYGDAPFDTVLFNRSEGDIRERVWPEIFLLRLLYVLV
ncbi:MAG: hypothetical protein FWF95_04735 [Syntrophorhabdaceae bacterium]|nr:hypothetical protein [Syntrophorhabdaceae bacterium]